MSNKILVKMLQAGETGDEILAILETLSTKSVSSDVFMEQEDDADADDDEIEYEEEVEEEEDDSDSFASKYIPTSEWIDF